MIEFDSDLVNVERRWDMFVNVNALLRLLVKDDSFVMELDSVNVLDKFRVNEDNLLIEFDMLSDWVDCCNLVR